MTMSDLIAAKALRALKDVQISNTNKSALSSGQAKRYREIQRLAKMQGMKYALEYIMWEIQASIELLEQEHPVLKDTIQ